MNNERDSRFAKAASEHSSGSIVHEFWEFLNHSKKWWLAPILIVLLLLGLLLVLSSTAAAPFIYTLF